MLAPRCPQPSAGASRASVSHLSARVEWGVENPPATQPCGVTLGCDRGSLQISPYFSPWMRPLD